MESAKWWNWVLLKKLNDQNACLTFYKIVEFYEVLGCAIESKITRYWNNIINQIWMITSAISRVELDDSRYLMVNEKNQSTKAKLLSQFYLQYRSSLDCLLSLWAWVGLVIFHSMEEPNTIKMSQRVQVHGVNCH